MKTFCLVFFLSSVIAVSGQVGAVDSLLKSLAYAKEDTNKVNLLLKIERKYFGIDLDSSLYYNQLCESLIAKLNATQFRHGCYHDFVKIYHAQGDFKKALEYCLKSIQVAAQDKNRFEAATSYRAIFNIYHNLGMNDSAVKYAVYSINLTTEIGDTTNIATNYGNLCWLYMDLSQYEQAADYGKKGIEAGVRYGDTVGLLVSINNLALCYFRTNKNLEAIELFKKQIVLAKQVNRVRSIRNALINLGVAYYYIGDIAGMATATASLNELNSNADLDNKNRCLQNITNAYYYIYLKEFEKAENELLTGLKAAEADSLVEQQLSIYITLSKVKFAQHQFVRGNFYEEKWDSLSQAQKEKELSQYAVDLQTKYDVEQKSSKIILQESQLKQKSLINYLLAGAGSALLIISLLSYRTYKQRQNLQQQRIAELETQQQLTATEAVLKGEEQERTRLAKDLHDGLGGMLSGIKYSFTTMKGNIIMTPANAEAFERSMDMLESSIKEMRRVAHNLMPEALVKFGLDEALRDFCNEINQTGALTLSYQSIGLEDVAIEQTTAITIYRIVQELINNTMKHAAARNAIVQLSKTGNDLSITVEDDGKGFDTSILKAGKGMGWSNIQNRVEFLKGKLDINSQPEKGTSVLIEINV